MRGRRTRIRSRKPIFLGCEGESEEAYGQFLNDLVRTRNLPFHIEVVKLNPGAGDPVSRLKRAVQEIQHRNRRRIEFQYRALLMDDDQIENVHRLQEIEAAAAKHGISIIWQSPCHEAFLLRHFAARLNDLPPDGATSMMRLRQAWPGYDKPATRLEISRRIDFEGVKRVSSSNAQLAALLRFIRLIN